ncbi:MAG: RES domain-containing protein [Chitinophagaceae bacterium]|nr:MAG: RES domain-containing protein [Chitinophagaceae bacterium]
MAYRQPSHAGGQFIFRFSYHGGRHSNGAYPTWKNSTRYTCMIVYRLATEQFVDDLSGTGAKLFGGRWNNVGIPVLYTTENISLALLEILVRADKTLLPPAYMLLKLELPVQAGTSTIYFNKLKKNWKDDVEYTQFIGSSFASSGDDLILKVPSAIVEVENNFVINPHHKDFKKVKIKSISKFQLDKRFFLLNE